MAVWIGGGSLRQDAGGGTGLSVSRRPHLSLEEVLPEGGQAVRPHISLSLMGKEGMRGA